MPRKASSQWEFGDLFDPKPKPAQPPDAESRSADPPQTPGPALQSQRIDGGDEEKEANAGEAPSNDSTPARRVFTVGELTGKVRRTLEGAFGTLWVTGEVSNLRIQPSGHSYFTLKDASAQLSCVLFRGEARGTRQLLQDGQHVVLGGDLTVYEPRGQYQLRVTAVEMQGVGALQLAFEQLKRKLQAEGLFDADRKRPLPEYPQCLGLVTSPTGAAIRDVLHVIERRQPSLEILLAPCRVQGDGAAREIAESIRRLNDWAGAGNRVDLILVTRGGGSLEDLWAFNEEIVARAIFESRLPVVSAVGHEIDFTISDFVADLRAATPSAAAELITEGPFASRQFVSESARRMAFLVRQRLADAREELARWIQRQGRAHPRRVIEERLQWLDDLRGSLGRLTRQGLRRHAVAFDHQRQSLARLRPSLRLESHRKSVADLGRLMRERGGRMMEVRRAVARSLAERLRLLGPDNVLHRGYSITTDPRTGRVIRSAREVERGQLIRTRLRSGQVDSTVTEREE